MATKKTTETETMENKAQTEAEAETEAEVEAAPAPDRTTVTHTLFRDGHHYKDDAVVGINGTFTTIQRGETVEMSTAVYEVLKHQEMADNAAAKRREEMSVKYEMAQKANML